MVEVSLIILGSALALIGSVVVQILRNRSDESQWKRERDEQRLMVAASDLARLRVFVEEYSPDLLVINYDPDDPFKEGNRRIEEWRPLRPPITRISLVHSDVKDQVDELVEKVLRMINVTGWQIRALVGGRTEDHVPHALAAKERALVLIGEIADALTE